MAGSDMTVTIAGEVLDKLIGGNGCVANIFIFLTYSSRKKRNATVARGAVINLYEVLPFAS